MEDKFDVSKADSQGTTVKPLAATKFDIEKYVDYEASLEDRCQSFWGASEGVSVYRRFRVPEVYSWGCRDKKMSLEWQLQALTQSIDFEADIPNFLEPWYGIGVLSSPFGIPYLWEEGQSPAVQSPYKTAVEALDHLQGSVAESVVGKEVLNWIEYFLENTKGRIPISLTDTQSPLNSASSYILDLPGFMYETFDHPDDVLKLIQVITDLHKDFIKAQKDLIGDALAKPGHGFASSRHFKGLGFSDDNILMFSDDDYIKFARTALCDAASVMDGPVFHSCGEWSGRCDLVKSIPGLIMADGAVGNQTDPCPNNPEVLGEAFAGSGIVLHVRIVGNAEIVEKYVKRIWRPGLKLIVASYCETEKEQLKAYETIHRICQ